MHSPLKGQVVETWDDMIDAKEKGLVKYVLHVCYLVTAI